MHSAITLEPTAPKAGTDLGATPPPATGTQAGTTGTTAAPPAAPSAPAGGGFGSITMLLPLLILLPFFFLQSRKQKKETEARGKLKKGDKVMTQSGILGELVEIDDRFAKVKLGPGLTVQMVATAVSAFDTAAPAATAEPKLAVAPGESKK